MKNFVKVYIYLLPIYTIILEKKKTGKNCKLKCNTTN